MNCKVWLLAALPVYYFNAHAQLRDTATHFLRNSQTREWSDFPAIVNDSRLVVRFDMKSHLEAGTLSLVQYDVNQTWKVLLNDKHLGNLVADEKKMTTYFDFPRGLLKAKTNVLKIVPEQVKTNRTDDITVGNLSVIPSPSPVLLSEVSVNIGVADKSNEFLPSRLTIVDANGALQPVNAKAGDTMAIRTGVIYSSTGLFTFSLPAGSYKVYASRGFEYGVDSMSLDVLAGDMVFRKLTVKHEIILPGWRSMDTHLHTLEFSGHGDASMNDRILTIAGEGLDYAVITEHNKSIDITGTVKSKMLDKWFTPVTGDEMTTPVGHFNVFPCEPAAVPDYDVKSWKEVKQNIENLPGKRVVILNHARDAHAGVRPSDSLFRKTADGLPVNAMEVMNSGSQQSDPRQLYMDWLNLISKGIFLVPVGSSDSHDVSRFIVGQSRTYVPSDGNVVDNFLKGRVGVSFGLFTELNVDTGSGQGRMHVVIKVYAPSWVTPANVALYANGQKIFSDSLSDKDRQVGHFYLKELSLATPPPGTKLVAIAEGPDPKVPWWPIARPYSWTSPDVTPIVLGIAVH